MDSWRPRLAGNPHGATFIYMNLRLALILVLCSPTLLSAAIPFGPERALVAPRTVIAEGTEVNASVASSGSETLVAWIDTTFGRQGVYLAALAADGSLVTGSQRRLATGATTVTLSWTGQAYLALWSAPESGIFATTLDRDRRTLIAPRLVLPGGQLASTVEWTVSRGMFVYVADGYRAAMIDRDGNVTRSGITFPGQGINSVRVFSNGQSFLAIWDIWRQPVDNHILTDVYAARYTAEGDLADATPVPIATLGPFSGTWEAAFDGTRYVLALAEAGQAATLRRFVIDPATLQATALQPVAMGGANGVRLEWNGSRFLAFWLGNQGQTYSLQTLSFAADGTGDAAPVTVSTRDGSALQPSGVWNGQALMVAWAGSGFENPQQYDVYATAVAGGEELTGSRFPIALAPVWQSRPAAATDGHQSLIVWLEGWNEESARLAAAHATAGRIDSGTVYLSDAAYGPAQVVFTGAAYLVFWLERTGNIPRLVMRRFDLAGQLAGAQELFIGNSYSFAVAFNGLHVLAAYATADGAAAVRFEADGTPLDTAPLFIPGAGAVRAASNGEDFALVWQEGSDALPINDGRLVDVYAAVINGTGATTQARIEVATGPTSQHSPVIATDGRDFVIAYVEEGKLLTKKLLREGALAGGAQIDAVAEGSGDGWGPFIAPTDGGYIAGWEVLPVGAPAAVRVVRLDVDGAVTETATVATSALAGMYPTLATGGGATGDLVYARLEDDPTYGASMRIFLRRLGEMGRPRGRAVRH
jgi:hypothetical protein